ncbi:MAG: head-tail connector protein [Alphaproteobacteria bacterium]
MRLQELTPPSEEPLTLSEAKLHLRITHDADDDALSALIRAAREMRAGWTGLTLVTRTYAFTADGWDGKPVELPRPPLVSVEEIAVYNALGEEELFDEDNYYAETAGRPGRIILKESASPPIPGLAIGGIEFRYIAGFGAAAAVPASLKQGMLRLVAHLYMNRGDSTEIAVRNSGAMVLFQPYRVARLA